MSKQQEPQTEALTPKREMYSGGTAAFVDNRLGIIQKKKLQQNITQSNRSPKGVTTGLPFKLKTGIENLSGYSMNDVQVHYNSGKPAQLNAHAYTQGAAIYLGPGQQKHLPHEAWHVVQQKQGRVQPTLQLKGKVAANNDAGLEKEADSMGAKAAHLGDAERLPTTAPVEKNSRSTTTDIVQGKFYFGEYAFKYEWEMGADLKSCFTKDDYEPDLDLTKYLNDEKERKIFIIRLQQELWKKYGKSDKPDMEMGAVLKIAKNWPSKVAMTVDRFMNELDKVSQDNINTPQEFKRRIGRDTRIPTELQEEYINAFNKRKTAGKEYIVTKEKVKAKRKEWVKANKEVADQGLLDGTYFKKAYEDIAITNIEDLRKHDFKTATSEEIDIAEFDKVFQDMEEKILKMKNELVGAWYFNNAAYEKIFDSNVMKCHTILKEEDANAASNTQYIDESKGTGSYCFFFIEHKNSAYNTGTRFNAPATKTGDKEVGVEEVKKDAGGQRLRYPLSKLVEQGAILMGGDLTQDKQETLKLHLGLHATPHKIFGSGTQEDQLEGLLKNHCNFIKARIGKAISGNSNGSKESGIHALHMIEELEGQDLWDYLNREVTQPQLLVPYQISLAMKEQKVDFQPPMHFVEEHFNKLNYWKGKNKDLTEINNLKPVDFAIMTLLHVDDPFSYLDLGGDYELKPIEKITGIEEGRFIAEYQEGDYKTYIKTKANKWWECPMKEAPKMIGDNKAVKTRVKNATGFYKVEIKGGIKNGDGTLAETEDPFLPGGIGTINFNYEDDFVAPNVVDVIDENDYNNLAW